MTVISGAWFVWEVSETVSAALLVSLLVRAVNMQVVSPLLVI